MFADDKSIENFQQLFFEFKKYLELQKEYTKLELTEKLTILFSTLIMILVLIILGMVALFYLLFALAENNNQGDENNIDACNDGETRHQAAH